MTTDWKTLSQKLLLVYLVIQVVLHDALAYNLYQNDVQVFTGKLSINKNIERKK